MIRDSAWLRFLEEQQQKLASRGIDVGRNQLPVPYQSRQNSELHDRIDRASICNKRSRDIDVCFLLFFSLILATTVTAA